MNNSKIHPNDNYDIIVIGAGPSGAVSSALLNKLGYRVLVLEKEHFPRFSIGESLLPQCMSYLEEADMLAAVTEANFQFKNGAAFCCDQQYEEYDFREKFTEGWGTTFQVQRGEFDKILADEASKQGVEIFYGYEVRTVEFEQQQVIIKARNEQRETFEVSAKFILDASGFGRVLPRLLDLNLPSELAQRTSIFTHIEDKITDSRFDRNKILITVHPKHYDIWYWLIPFKEGRASVGVVVPNTFLQSGKLDSEASLKMLISQGGMLNDVLEHALFDTPVRQISGYSSNVKQLYGNRYALLGNAGEFLDPVFSSGVTIALKSASLAARVVDQELCGLKPDWQVEFSRPLQAGVNTFKSFVQSWYAGQLQDIIFSQLKGEDISRMISSILAGYAWDHKNPYVKDPIRLKTLAEICRQ